MLVGRTPGQFGSDVRRTTHDVLVRDPAIGEAAAIPESLEQLLGRKRSTLDTLPETEAEGMRQAIQARIEENIPSLNKTSAGAQIERTASIGQKAPEGYKWVPREALPQELTKAPTARTKFAKVGDQINAAVTAATVYLKLGHFPTRVLTNATTNILQGSARPSEIAKSVKLTKGLSETEVHELASVTGTHGYAALPHEGMSRIARVAGKGANWWAGHVDAPFRINAVLHELRQRGFTTPEQVRGALNELKNPGSTKMSGPRLSQLHAAVREANRASIMYDGLSDVEKRYVTRYLWFYPWTKGAVRYAGHVVAEHPVKASAIAAVGSRGAQIQQQTLGNVPSYELGLTALSGGANPLTANFSTFNPFSTVGTAAEVAAHPLNPDEGVLGQLNPAYGGLAALAAGKGLSAAAGEIVQPTPEAQALSAGVVPRGSGLFPTSTQYLFGRSWQSTLARGLVGAGFPRRVNKSRLAIDAQHENEKHHDIRIWGS